MAPDWCSDWAEIGTDEDGYPIEECLVFKNDFEEAKHFQNGRMHNRNQTLLGVEFALWFLVGALVVGERKSEPCPAYLSRRGLIPLVERFWWSNWERIAYGLMLVYLVLIISLILSWVLPPPIEWFPRVITDINETLVEAELQRIRRSLW